MRVAAILLCAGEGRRMGGNKALVGVGGRTLLAGCAERLARPGVFRLIVVLGHEAERVAASAGVPEAAMLVGNPRFREGGMLSSILCGLDAAEESGAEAVLVHPVDHPFVSETTVDRVLAALAAGAAIAVPSFAGRRGHPAGFASAVWPLLRAAPPELGARAVLQRCPERVVHVSGDAGCTAGVNTPAELEKAAAFFARGQRGPSREPWPLEQPRDECERPTRQSKEKDHPPSDR